MSKHLVLAFMLIASMLVCLAGAPLRAWGQSLTGPQSRPAHSYLPVPLLTPALETATQPASQPANLAPTASMAASQPAAAVSPADDPTRLVPWLDYTGGFWKSAAMTGDWCGVRQQMMDKGIRVDASLIQVLQGVWSGGVHKWPEYQGNMRYDVQIDTGKAGLWPGGMFYIRGETRYGNSDNAHVGSVSPVDTLSLYPQPGTPITALTDFYYVQFVAPQLGFLIGKVAPRMDNVFASDETSQFMNTAFNFPLIAATTYPLDALQVGVFVIPTDWLKVSTFVIDADGTAANAGWDTVFVRGTSVFQMAEFTIKPFNLPGHQRLGWAWTDKQHIQFEQNSRGLIIDFIKSKLGLGPSPTLAREGSDWCIFYDFDQYLYTVPGKKDQGFGLFGGVGTSDGVVNPIGQYYDIGVGGKGMIPTRDNDQYGVGFYFVTLSDKLMGLPVIQRLNRLGRGLSNESGIELYYNIAVTPWLHITPDLQIIDGALTRADTAVVAGLRVKMDF